MRVSLREDSEGVASTLATLFTLVVILLFMQIALFGAIPQQQYEAERRTTLEALEAFELLRSTASGAAVPGASFTLTIPMGTAAVAPFSSNSEGRLEFNTDNTVPANVSFSFVPHQSQGRVTKVDQDVVLAIDSSGSMVWNDPNRLRISSAQEYVRSLRFPDRVAIVDFDSVARLTRANVGQLANHLWSQGHNGIPDYSGAESDLNTIDQSGSTNYGDALRVANDELITYGEPGRQWVVILLTDGQNTASGADALAQSEAQRALANGITVYTIGLGPDVDDQLLMEIAATTGGTYYAAPTPESIRWIYFEISQSFLGFIECGSLTAQEAVSGSLTLSLGNRQYPAQTVRLNAGGITIEQPDGAIIRSGVPMTLQPTIFGTGDLRITLLTFIGPAFRSTGTDFAFLRASFLGQRADEHIPFRASLSTLQSEVDATSDYVEFWAGQGAATPGAAAAVQAPLQEAYKILGWGHTNMTDADPVSASFNVERARSQLSAAVTAAQAQDDQAMQRWLKDALAFQRIPETSCKLEEWQNWYDGITIEIRTPQAAAWARWFNQTYKHLPVPVAFGASGDLVVLKVNAIDRLILDERIIELELG